MTFLRPEWLWLLPVLIAALLFWQHRQSRARGWAAHLPPAFLEVLSSAPGRPAGQLSRRGLLLLAAVLIPIALSGPSWRTDQMPVQQKSNGLVIALDLSLSMLAEDVRPSRLVRARQKISDLLDRRTEGLTGLIAYAGSAHAVTPLTEDKATVAALLPALDPMIMPAFGNKLPDALTLADDMLRQGGNGQGRILVVTDGIDPVDREAIEQWRQSSGTPVSILAVGSSEGGPIPIPDRGFLRSEGEVVISRVDHSALSSLMNGPRDHYSKITLNDRDLGRLLPETVTDYRESESGQAVEQPLDEGYWLLIPLVLAFAWLGYRYPVFCLVIGFSLLLTPPVKAADYPDWLKNDDRKGLEAFEASEFENAASLFSQPEWQAMALYRQERYQEAASLLEGINTAEAHYNRGNALAYAGDIQGAIQAYQKALNQRQEFPEARDNLEALLELQQQQQQQQEDSRNQEGSDSQDAQQNQEGSDSQDAQQNQGSSGSQSAQPNPEQGKKGQPSGQEQTQEDASAPPSEQDKPGEPADAPAGEQPEPEARETDEAQAARAAAETTPELEAQQADQWLRRIPDEPGSLLRRKFLQQYQMRSQNTDEEGRQLW